MVNNSSAGSTTSNSRNDSSVSGDDKSMPKDARTMISILKDMGVNDFEPRVVNQLLEFSYGYISTVLDDSKMLSSHARKKAVDMDDVKLAVKMHTDHNLTSPPPRDLLLEVASKRNAIPLPIPKQSGGLRLPPDRFCLTATNYRLKPNKKKASGVRANAVGGQGGYGGNYSINSMNSIPPAMKSQVSTAGKIAINVTGAPPAASFTMKQLPTTPGTVTSQPAAIIKINHTGNTSNQTPTLNAAAKIQIQPGATSSNSGTPMFSMTVNPPMLNAATPTGVKRKADQMENHTN